MVDCVYAIQCGALLGNNMVLYRLIILQGSAMQHKISGIYALKYWLEISVILPNKYSNILAQGYPQQRMGNLVLTNFMHFIY